jgi:hypothetical protein
MSHPWTVLHPNIWRRLLFLRHFNSWWCFHWYCLNMVMTVNGTFCADIPYRPLLCPLEC